MANAYDWLKKRARGVTAQVNPFDNGATYSTVLNDTKPAPMPKPEAAPQSTPMPSVRQDTRSGLSKAFDQLNPFDSGRTWKAPEPTKPPSSVWHQATHNAVTNVAGDIAKPVVRFPLNWSNMWANLGHRAGGGQQQTPEEQFTDPFTSRAVKMTGATGSGRQLIGDAVNIGLTAVAPGSSKIVEQGVSKALPKVLPQTVRTITSRSAGMSTAGAAAGGPSSVATLISDDDVRLNKENLWEAYRTGTMFGAAGGAALPVAGAGAKIVTQAANKGLRSLSRSQRNAVLETAGQRSPIKIADNDKLISYEGAPDRVRVDYYKDKIRAGEDVGPLYIMREGRGGRFGIEDGKHRHQAYKELGIKRVPVKVVTPESITRIRQGGYVGIPGLGDEGADAAAINRSTPNSSGSAQAPSPTSSRPEVSTSPSTIPPDSLPTYAEARRIAEADDFVARTKAILENPAPERPISGRGAERKLTKEDSAALKALREERRAIWKELAPAREQLKSLKKQREQLDILARQRVAANDIEGAKQVRTEHADLTYRHQLAANKERELSRKYADTKKRELEIRKGVSIAGEPGISDAGKDNGIPIAERQVGQAIIRKVMRHDPKQGFVIDQEIFRPEPRNLEEQIAQGKVRIAEFDPRVEYKIQKRSEDEFKTLSERGLMGDYILDKGVLKKRYQKPDVVTKDGEGVVKLDGGETKFKRVRNAVITDEDDQIVGIAMGGHLIDSDELSSAFSKIDSWKDTRTFTRTIDRVLEAAAPTDADYRILRRFLLEPREQAVADMTQAWNVVNREHKEVIQSLGLKGKQLDEAMADIQHYGEQTTSRADLVKKYGEPMVEKIDKAVVWYRNTFDSLLDTANSTLKQFGYEPIPKRENYFTHFREQGTWEKFGIGIQNMMQPTKGNLFGDVQVNAARGAVPESMVGKTGELLPGKKFNQFALRRNGGEFTPHAGKALETYLPNILNNIYLTGSIVRGRTLERAVELTNRDKGTLSRLVKGLREYNNHLAGKSSETDRWAIDRFGRGLVDTMGVIQAIRGKSSILGSMSSALMQISSLPQAYGVAGPKNFALGAMQQARAAVERIPNDPLSSSRFMAIRYGDVTNNFRSKFAKFEDVAGAPLHFVEQRATEIIWRTMHNKALADGLRGKAALLEADRLTSRTVGSRNFGDRSELMRTKLFGPATQFRLEVFNAAQQVAGAHGELNPLKHPVQFMNYAMAAAATGWALSQVLGRQPLLSPLHAVIDAGQGIFGADDEYGEGAIAPLNVAAEQVLQNTPFAPEVAQLLDIQGRSRGSTDLLKGTNFDRFGYSNTVGSTLTPLIDLGIDRDADSALRAVTGFVPTGGQIRKTIQGATAETDNPLERVKGLLFGKSAMAREGNTSDSPSGALGDALRADEELKKRFRAAFSDEDYAIRGLSKGEREALIASGLLTRDKVDGLDRYELDTQRKLGIPAGDRGQSVPEGAADLDDDFKAFYTDRSYVYDGDYDNWQKGEAKESAAVLLKRASGMADGRDPLPQTNEVAEMYADFAKRRTAEKWGSTKENSEKLKFLRTAYKTRLSPEQREWYSLSDTDLRSAIEAGELGANELDGLIGFDDRLRGFGMSGEIGNTLRRDYGYRTWGGRSSGSSSRRSRGVPDLPASYFDTASLATVFRNLLNSARL